MNINEQERHPARSRNRVTRHDGYAAHLIFNQLTR